MNIKTWGLAIVLALSLMTSAQARHHHHGRTPWCGIYMMERKNLHQAGLALARNWAKVGVAVQAQVGAIVVWAHHVGEIVGGSPGHWIVNSGNDGNAVRTRERSVAGAIAFRML